ncbi:MAG: GNAT family N-acetyltransferase [Rhodospirillales bacterium]
MGLPSPDTDGKISTVITYLEMTQPQAGPKPAMPPNVVLQRVEQCSVAFYRFLYNTVGQDWLWYERRLTSDDELEALLRDPAVTVYVAYRNGAPAGYFELDGRQAGVVDLAYFGLLPEAIGQGIGPWLLHAALDLAWAQNPVRVTINTNSLDHPAALPTYRKAGFLPYRQVQHRFDDPRLAGII